MVHSDQGIQGSYDWRDFLDAHNLQQSMSRRGNGHDNALAENFFQLIKRSDRGLAKSNAQLFTLFALANLVLAPKWRLERSEQRKNCSNWSISSLRRPISS